MQKPTSEVVTMDAPKGDSPMLSREQIDSVIGSMSAADLVDAMTTFDASEQSLQMAIAAFDSAAARAGLSNGAKASQHVRMSDLKYLGEKIKEGINVDSPLSEGQKG